MDYTDNWYYCRMSGDGMDIVLAGEEDNDCIGEDSCNPSKFKQGARSSKSSRYRMAEVDSELYQRRLVDITRDKPIKVVVRVALPVRDHPKFNFVGKLLGPKGNSLKRLQEETMTRMAILGKGSMRDRHKEEELRNSGDPRFSHLSDELHVEVTAFASPAEAHARIAYALSEVRRFLVPDYNDEIRQEQMWEMRVLNRSSSPNTTTNNDTNNNNDYNSIDKNVEQHSNNCNSVRGSDKLTCNEPKSWPTPILQTQSRLCWALAKTSEESDETANCAPICSNSGFAAPELEASALATPVSTPVPAPTSTLPSMPHPATRGLKNKSVVALASSPLPTHLTMVGRRRCLLGGAAYGTRLFMSPTKRTVLSILARAKAAQCNELVSGFAGHPPSTPADVHVSSSLSDRWTLLVDS